MNYELIEVAKEDRITIITINRPEVLNSISAPTSLEMDTALGEFQDDPEAWVCIVTGAGEKAFSAGMDLKWFNRHGGQEYSDIMSRVKGGFGGLTKRYDCPKPIIAAVNGLAFGGGFEMALSCDIVVAAEHATFSLPEPKVGLMAAEGGIQRLARFLPYQTAMGIFLTARRIPAAEALKLGLVNEIAPAAELMDAARRWAAEILACSPMAIRATKESAQKGLKVPLAEAIEAVFPRTAEMYRSEDMAEGQAAFIEKRKPVWKGR